MDAPRQNWALYEERVMPEHAKWLQGLTYEQSFDIFRSLVRLAANLPNSPEEMELINRRRWEEKLEARRRQVEAFRALDAIRDARAASNLPE
jgi:hypothetical protein